VYPPGGDALGDDPRVSFRAHCAKRAAVLKVEVTRATLHDASSLVVRTDRRPAMKVLDIQDHSFGPWRRGRDLREGESSSANAGGKKGEFPVVELTSL
jgi:hypothetical protein